MFLKLILLPDHEVQHLTDRLTPCSRVLLEELIVTKLFYGTQRFITTFTTAHHWFLS